MAALLESKPSDGLKQLAIFVEGPHKTINFKVETSSPSSPPKPLFIVTPTEPGEYPVLQFHHGTILLHIYYTHLLTHIASHGYIVVAPQLYAGLGCLFTTIDEEVRRGGKVTDWLLSSSLEPMLPDNVHEDLTKLALAGHSRGGKVAFILALNHAKTPSNPFKALIGIDPVAGAFPHKEIPPIIFDHSFNLSVPVTVIGTGVDWPLLRCAPEGVNHDAFYKNSEAPCGQFVAKDYGHIDMLDDDAGFMFKFMIKSGKGPKDSFRRCVGGIVVASLMAGFEKDFGDLNIICQDPEVAPVNLVHCEYKIEP